MIPRTASGRYAMRANEIRLALAEIRALLRRHAREQAKDPTNYGYAGSLAHVAEELRDVAGFLAGGKA